MKVLQVVDGYGWGGTKEQVYLLTKYLKKRNIDVEIALSFQYEEMVKKLSPYNVKIHYFENHVKNARYRWENYKRLIEIINTNNYDIVIANSPHAFDYVRVAKIFLKSSPRIINVKRSARIPSILSKYLKYAAADKIVVVSRQVKETLEKANFFPEKLTVIESGIELDRFKPQPEKKEILRRKLGLPLDKKIFVKVANWNPQVKGQDKLIETFSKIRCDDCLLVLVGLDTDKEAKKVARKFNIEDKVIGLGFRTDVPDILNASDFFVMSSFLEGIAGALLQAMAAGKVVISTLAGGIGEYLIDGYNGFSVPVGEFQLLGNKMKEALKLDKEEYNKLSQNAIKTAKNYSMEKTTDKYIQLFQELLA